MMDQIYENRISKINFKRISWYLFVSLMLMFSEEYAQFVYPVTNINVSIYFYRFFSCKGSEIEGILTLDGYGYYF